jgi:hypothetical protein
MSDDFKLTEQEWHRKQAVDLFNFTWTLIDKPDRTTDDDNLMIHAAHASRYHWGIVGTAVNFLRGDWQIAHVYPFLGQAQPALYHAQRCLDQCRANNIGDFDLAYAYEGAARACAGQTAKAQQYHQLAEQAGAAIAEEEDRQMFQKDLAVGPWFDQSNLLEN